MGRKTMLFWIGSFYDFRLSMTYLAARRQILELEVGLCYHWLKSTFLGIFSDMYA